MHADASYSAHDQALKPLLLMLRETDNTSTIRTLVLKALSDPHIFYGFDEIKRHSKNNLEDSTINNTLDLFSFGTYLDYTANPSNYITLTDSQVNKLKLLSVVTLVQRACDENKQSVSYSEIAAALNNTSPDDNDSSLRAVEQVVVTGIYAGMLHGKLCQRTKMFVFGVGDGAPCLSRDVVVVVKKDVCKSMLETLQNLQIKVNTAMVSIENEKQVLMVKRHAERDFWMSAKLMQTAKQQPAAVKDDSTTSAWPTSSPASRSQDAAMRSSASGGMTSQRQSKRSRGGFGMGATSAFGGMGLGRF